MTKYLCKHGGVDQRQLSHLHYFFHVDILFLKFHYCPKVYIFCRFTFIESQDIKVNKIQSCNIQNERM